MTSSIPWKTIVIKISVSLGMLSSNIRNSWSVSFFIRICASFTSLEGNVVTLALEMFKFLECNTTNFVDLRTSHLISTLPENFFSVRLGWRKMPYSRGLTDCGRRTLFQGNSSTLHCLRRPNARSVSKALHNNQCYALTQSRCTKE